MNIGKFELDKFWAKHGFFFKILIFLFPAITLFFNFLSPQFVSDSRMHLLIADNLLHGFGHSYLEANPIDVSKTITVPISFWPPGYSLLLIPFILIGLKSVWIIALSDALAIALFYLCWYRILKLTCVNNFRRMVIIVFAFFAFGFTPLGMYYAYGSNIWSLLWFSLALLQLEVIITKHQIPSWNSLSVFYIFVFLCSFFRYAFYPISLVMCFGIVFLFYKKDGFKRVSISLLIPLMLFGSFFYYQYYNSNSLNYVSSYHTGNSLALHWDNLKHSTPFVANSFLFPINYKSVIWPVSFSYLLRDLSILNNKQIFNSFLKITFTLIISAFLIMALYKKYGMLNGEKRRIFILLFSLIISQLFLFVMLSLKYPPEIFKGINTILIWTYVEEVRYFNVINLIILVGGIWAFMSLGKKYSIAIIASIFAYNIWSFYKTKSEESFNPSKNITDKNFWILTYISEKMKVQNAVLYEKELEQRKSNYHFVSTMYAEQGIKTLKFIDPVKVKTTRPVTLIFAIDKIENDGGDDLFRQLIIKNKAFKIGALFNSKVEIWGLEFKPGQTLKI